MGGNDQRNSGATTVGVKEVREVSRSQWGEGLIAEEEDFVGDL